MDSTQTGPISTNSMPYCGSTPNAPGKKLWDGPHLTVLLVEDNPTNLHLAAAILEKMGHSTVLALNGQEAVERFIEQPFDVVLMDIQMPVLDGEEALKRLRAFERSRGGPVTPVIAITAHAQRGDRERLLGSGFDGYLAKPYRIEGLAAEMHAAIRKH